MALNNCHCFAVVIVVTGLKTAPEKWLLILSKHHVRLRREEHFGGGNRGLVTWGVGGGDPGSIHPGPGMVVLWASSFG